MKIRLAGPGYIDTARPLPFQMRHARWLEGEGDADGGGDGDGGGESDDDGGDSDAGDDEDDSDVEGAESLGDAGKQALDRMKEKWRAERDARRALEEKLAAASTKDDAEAEQRQREAAALAKANQRILRSEVKAEAKGLLADPTDAFKFLDLEQFEVDNDGNVDSDEIRDALRDLVDKKPYLAAQGGRRFQGGADGGTRKETRPKQLTRADLAGMTPQEIAAAKAKGQLADLLKSKN